MKLHSLKIIGFKRIEAAENTRAWLIRVSSGSIFHRYMRGGVYAHGWTGAVDTTRCRSMIDTVRVGIKTCPPYLTNIGGLSE